jgi:hypothetical protein
MKTSSLSVIPSFCFSVSSLLFRIAEKSIVTFTGLAETKTLEGNQLESI